MNSQYQLINGYGQYILQELGYFKVDRMLGVKKQTDIRKNSVPEKLRRELESQTKKEVSVQIQKEMYEKLLGFKV